MTREVVPVERVHLSVDSAEWTVELDASVAVEQARVDQRPS